MITRNVILRVLEPVDDYLSGTLSYDEASPAEITITLHGGRDRFGDKQCVTWQFARSLLRDGLHAESGIGDVRVAPVNVGFGTFVVMKFNGIDDCNEDSEMVLALRWNIAARFLERTYMEVPYCDESKRMTPIIDNAIHKILAV